jgi:hypothetical protein
MLAAVAGFVAPAPASAAGPSVCIASHVNVNGTAAPTNGTTCLP